MAEDLLREDLFSATFFAVFLAEGGGGDRVGVCERIEFSCEIPGRVERKRTYQAPYLP